MVIKIGRNEPCPCGSGKKYKKCCLDKEESAVTENNLNSKNQYDDNDDDLDLHELLTKAAVDLHRWKLNKKPHIKEYKQIRKMHTEIAGGMIKYYEEGKFEHKFDAVYNSGNKKENVVILLESEFDMESREGPQAFYDILIYKISPNANCITEEFIKTHRYRKPEKIDFLQNMLDSKLGLFEITSIDSEEGYAYIKEVFTNIEYKITDTGLSYGKNYDDMYIYTRIITYNNISFSTGLSLLFDKTDRFIQDFIKREQKDYKPIGEFVRFTKLYNHFSKDSKRVKVIGKKF